MEELLTTRRFIYPLEALLFLFGYKLKKSIFTL